jgi:hypothetical protein
MTPFASDDVAAKFESYPRKVRGRMLALRELVFKTADQTPSVGEIQETLKWGEPAYVTRNKAGSTLRMDWKAKSPEEYAMYFHCQTNLVETFRQLFPKDFRFDGNRALIFDISRDIPVDALQVCIAAAFTYHLRKKIK